MSGKGDKQRPRGVTWEQYGRNWQRVFDKKTMCGEWCDLPPDHDGAHFKELLTVKRKGAPGRSG